MRKILTLLLLLCFSVSFSQTITLKGKITDNDNFPLESATIYLTNVKDSTMVDYTISNKNGNWELKIKKLDKPVFLKVSYVGLANHREQLNDVAADRDFGTIKLADLSTELNEVVIENEIPPIRIKKDTLEFDAASFKVRPDANVETLLKQLPGVEIDDEGKIRVNGKEVNQILVNGKPFFDKDGKIALQNLPADIINKVQVTDTKTKKEEYTGKDASGNNASINLTIDEEKNKGFFGRFLGGYGSDKRYEANALVNYFKGSRKLSVLASSNNINTTGFTMDEIFDSMGGGRNNTIYTSSDGSFGINDMRFGGNRGITRTNIFGATYSDELFKGFTPNLNYFYTAADTENDNRTRSESFIPATPGSADTNRSLISESSSRTDTNKYAHNMGGEFEFKIDSTSTVYFSPKFIKANSKTAIRSASSTRNQDNALLNESSGSTFDETDNNAFSANLNYNKILNKKGRSLAFEVNMENKLEDASAYNNTSTYFYGNPDNPEDEGRSDIRNQLQKNITTNDTYRFNFEFNEAITDSLSISAGATYSKDLNTKNRKGYNFNDFTGGFTNIADSLTNYLRSDETRITPYAGINISKSKFYMGANFGTAITNYGTFGSYLGKDYVVNKNYMLPWANAYANIRFTKSMYIYLNYSFSADMPTVDQILPITDVSSALYTITGNENLTPNKSHNTYIGFGNYDYASRSGYSIYVGGNYYESNVTQFTTIDESGKQFITYGNLGGTFSSYGGGNWSKQIKTEGAHKYRINASINGGFSKNKGKTNDVLYESLSYNIGPKIGFTYEYGDLLTISPIYSFDYEETHFDNFTTDFTSRFVHKAGLQTTNYWPKHVVFGNDFTYTYNSNLGDGFKRDFFLWNTSLGYSFLSDKAMFKVKVYDVFNQNLGTTRSISPTTIADTQNTVLKRYVMFSLSFKIDNFGKKRENNENERRFWQF